MTERKLKENVFKVFYERNKMPEKLTYVNRIMETCDTKEQLDIAYKWGLHALESHYSIGIDDLNYNSAWDPAAMALRLGNLMRVYRKDVEKHYKKIYDRLTRV